MNTLMTKKFKIIFFAGLGLAIILAIFLYAKFLGPAEIFKPADSNQNAVLEGPDQSMFSREGEDWAKFTSDQYNFFLEYRQAPDGYNLKEEEEIPEDVAAVFNLIRKKDAEAMALNQPPAEGPPVISIQIIPNPDKLPLRDWLNQNQYANFDLKTSEPQIVAVEDYSGLKYSWSGLYDNDTIAVWFQDDVFLFNVGYSGPNDPIRQDFDKFMLTLDFMVEPLPL